MGNSSSRCNDSMIDNLVKRDIVLVRNVERAFRLVDRALFIPAEQQSNAYSDLPLKVKSSEGGRFFPGALHLSTTEVYVTALRQLEIEKGHAFLNIGTGSGYLSTIAGFLVGANGQNHGIEYYENLVDYAEERIDEWLKSPGANSTSWTRPELVVGDIYDERFLESHAKHYDRIFLSFMHPQRRVMARVLRMLRVGGVLVAPNQDSLCRFVRTGEEECVREQLGRMSFSVGVQERLGLAEPPRFEPVPSLCVLARRAIQKELRAAAFTRDVRKSIAKTVLTEKGSGNYPVRRAAEDADAPHQNRRRDHHPREPAQEDAVLTDLQERAGRLMYANNRDQQRLAQWRNNAAAWVNTEGPPSPPPPPPPPPPRRRRVYHVVPPPPPLPRHLIPPPLDRRTEADDLFEDIFRRHREDQVLHAERLRRTDEVLRVMNARILEMHEEQERLALIWGRPDNNRRSVQEEDKVVMHIVHKKREAEDHRADGDLSCDDEPEEKSTPKLKKTKCTLGAWLEEGAETDDEPQVDTDDDEEGASTSSARPYKKNAAHAKRTNEAVRKDDVSAIRRKRARRERDAPISTFFAPPPNPMLSVREMREEEGILSRPERDLKIKNAAEAYERRLQNLPLPMKLKNFIRNQANFVEN